MLSGRFKREVQEKSLCQPLSWTTQSGVEIWFWFYKVLVSMINDEVTLGPFFRVKGLKENCYKQASMGDIQPLYQRTGGRVFCQDT